MPVKAGSVELADGSTVDYDMVDGERVAWVAQVSFGRGGCGHVVVRPPADLLRAAGFRSTRTMIYADAGGRCPACTARRSGAAAGRAVVASTDAELGQAKAAAAAPEPPKYRQNVKTGMRCPDCGLELLLMTRKKDGRRFIACAGYYTAAACAYTSNDVPAHILAREAGVPMLPLPGLG